MTVFQSGSEVKGHSRVKFSPRRRQEVAKLLSRSAAPREVNLCRAEPSDLKAFIEQESTGMLTEARGKVERDVAT